MENLLLQKVSSLQKIFGPIVNRFLSFLFLQGAVLILMNRRMTGYILTWFDWTNRLPLMEKTLPFLKRWLKRNLLLCYGWAIHGIQEMLIIIVNGVFGTGHIMIGR